MSRDVCYKFVTDRRADFADAQQYCKLQGGSLASMRTPDEMVFLNGLRSTHYSKYYKDITTFQKLRKMKQKILSPF